MRRYGSVRDKRGDLTRRPIGNEWLAHTGRAEYPPTGNAHQARRTLSPGPMRPHPSKGGSGSDVGIRHVGARGCEVFHPVAMMQAREPGFGADGLQSGLRGHASVVELGGDFQRHGQQSVPHVYRFG